MAWNKATRRKHGRSDDHRQNCLTDAERAIVGPMLSAAEAAGPAAHHRPSERLRRDPAHPGLGVPVAAPAQLFSAVFHGAELLL